MKNTSILRRIMGLALSLALLVSMMPVLASEVYAARETVHVYKEDGTEANKPDDYEWTDSSSECQIKKDKLRVTTNGFVVNAHFTLNNQVNDITFEDCRVFDDGHAVISCNNITHDQTINIKGDCDFLDNSGGQAMDFKYEGKQELTFTSSDKNNSLNIESFGQALDSINGALNFTGELNATISGKPKNEPNVIDVVGNNLTIKDNVDLKVNNLRKNSETSKEGITIGGEMYMAGNSNLEVHSNGTAISVQKGLLIRENASLSADSYHYVVVKTNEEAEFDTTGRVELTNYHSDGLLCKKLKMLNRDGAVLIRGTESTAIKLINQGDITLGNGVKMYGSTNLYEPENSITKKFVDVIWKDDGNPNYYYHPYFAIDDIDTPIKAILIKGSTTTPGGGGSIVDSGELEKLKEGLASADAKIEELDEQLRELVNNLMSTKTKFSKIKSSSKRKVAVRFNKIPGAQKYEIKYKQAGKRWKLAITERTTKTFKKLKSGKKFYVKVRGLYEKDSLKVASPWSKTKSIRVK